MRPPQELPSGAKLMASASRAAGLGGDGEHGQLERSGWRRGVVDAEIMRGEVEAEGYRAVERNRAGRRRQAAHRAGDRREAGKAAERIAGDRQRGYQPVQQQRVPAKPAEDAEVALQQAREDAVAAATGSARMGVLPWRCGG
jgi:hypothetical protein